MSAGNSFVVFYIIFTATIGAVFAFVFFISPLDVLKVEVEEPEEPEEIEIDILDKVQGWAWAGVPQENGEKLGLGWISLNCHNPELPEPRCSRDNDYGIYVESNGNMVGYAYYDMNDSNMPANGAGWIDFDPHLEEAPDSSDSTARVDWDGSICGTAGCVYGWARAVGHGNGWDGWIKLRGKATDGSPYGTRLADDGYLKGWAWGGNVVGWVSFDYEELIKPLEHTVAYRASEGGSVSPSLKAVIQGEASVVPTTSSNPGYQLAGFSVVSGSKCGDFDSSTGEATNVTCNMEIKADFVAKKHIFSINTVGVGRVLKNPDQATYKHNDSVKLTAVADQGWEFVRWSGDLRISANPAMTIMNRNKNITAHFQVIEELPEREEPKEEPKDEPKDEPEEDLMEQIKEDLTAPEEQEPKEEPENGEEEHIPPIENDTDFEEVISQLNTLQKLVSYLNQDFTFEPKEGTLALTPQEFFQRRRGGEQDFAVFAGYTLYQHDFNTFILAYQYLDNQNTETTRFVTTVRDIDVPKYVRYDQQGAHIDAYGWNFVALCQKEAERLNVEVLRYCILSPLDTNLACREWTER